MKEEKIELTAFRFSPLPKMLRTMREKTTIANL